MEKNTKYERRYELDWLRIIAIILLFFFHSAKFFDTDDFHINNNEQDIGMTIFVGILTTWIMPLFFPPLRNGYFLLFKKKRGRSMC